MTDATGVLLAALGKPSQGVALPHHGQSPKPTADCPGPYPLLPPPRALSLCGVKDHPCSISICPSTWGFQEAVGQEHGPGTLPGHILGSGMVTTSSVLHQIPVKHLLRAQCSGPWGKGQGSPGTACRPGLGQTTKPSQGARLHDPQSHVLGIPAVTAPEGRCSLV